MATHSIAIPMSNATGLMSLKENLNRGYQRKLVITIPSILNDVYIFHQQIIYLLHQTFNMRRPGSMTQSEEYIHSSDQG